MVEMENPLKQPHQKEILVVFWFSLNRSNIDLHVKQIF